MTILILEPFYGGSHKQLIDLIQLSLKDKELEIITQTAKKWHWRARTSAVWFSQKIGSNIGQYSHIFSSSVLNLCELLGLRPDLNSARNGSCCVHLIKNIYYAHLNFSLITLFTLKLSNLTLFLCQQLTYLNIIKVLRVILNTFERQSSKALFSHYSSSYYFPIYSE
jgi:hypothetical protein